jgi:hypothetical protein
MRAIPAFLFLLCLSIAAEESKKPTLAETLERDPNRAYGWPLVAYQKFREFVVTDEMVTITYESSGPVRTLGDKRPPRKPIQIPKIRETMISSWNLTAFLIDFLIVIGILFSVAFASEFLIRRREARKT